ncbi:hypothetical protein C8034_v007236 [Colletotrichum sidae]|uniref:Uncharacterized protein n=1 Tax=Colletotrichum sidae TaxID=1347389 RepID=A0A4R8T3Z7_9PEZI|nr:hypothetical protein C8034_v007236 [Colletotrichum sidae]
MMDTSTSFPLLGASQECLEAFHALIDSLEKPDEKSGGNLTTGIVKVQRDRFKIWAMNLGALQRGRASLDFRLLESSLTKSAILRFLNELKDTLLQSNEVVQGSRPPLEHTITQDLDYSSDETSSGSNDEDGSWTTELGQNATNIDHILTSLGKITVRIRKPSSRKDHVSRKALEYTQTVMMDGSEKDLLQSYADFDRRHTVEYFRQIRKSASRSSMDLQTVREDSKDLLGHGTNSYDDHLCERWSKSLTTRRRIFAYWRRHARKLATTEGSSPSRIESAPRPSQLPSTNAAQPLQHVPRNSYAASLVPTSLGRTILSGTEATAFTHDGDHLDTATISTFSCASTTWGAEGQSTELPAAPSLKPQHNEFLCPYCHVLCPSKDLRRKQWL